MTDHSPRWAPADRPVLILLDDMGRVSEGTGENVFVVREGEIVTPGHTASILDGISRKSVIQIASDMGYSVVERDIARAETRLALSQLADGLLDDREREIIRLRFEDDRIQREIGERVGCSQMHVSRLIRRALERLRTVAEHSG